MDPRTEGPVWQEAKAQLALRGLNKKMAALYCQPVQEVTFVFVPLIDQRRVLDVNGSVVTVREVLGDCTYELRRIRIVAGPHWMKTAIHELVHLYNRGRSEKWVRQRTEEAVSYLKMFGAA